MNLFQILDCEGLKGVIGIIKTILVFFRWIIPVALIIYGTIDMFKAMTKEKEEDQKKIRETFIRRLIYAIVAFLIPVLVDWVFGLAGNLTANVEYSGNGMNAEPIIKNANIFTCWNAGTANTGGETSSKGTCDCNNGITLSGLSQEACSGFCADKSGIKSWNNN